MLIQVLDPTELSLPFSGNMIFKQDDTQGAQKHHITNIASVREAYQTRIQDHISSLKAMCRKFEWHYCLHENGQPLAATLNTVWSYMAKGGAMHK